MAKETMRQTPDKDTILGETTGSTMTPKDGEIFLEGLGSLDSFPDHVATEDQEGVGEYCVVLSNILSGNGNMYKQGDVRRLSHFIVGYDDPSVSRDDVKKTIKRFFGLKALRLATSQESKQTWVKIDIQKETDEMSAMRSKTIALEQTNEALMKKIEELQGGNAPVAPASVVPPPPPPPDTSNELS